ncbi:MAG: hypothetical protein ABWZ78_04060 [Burkholderiaceae bacterium]
MTPIGGTAAAAANPARALFAALFATALDPDAEPLQWVDPRGLLGCGPGTAVRVNGDLLRPAAPVPDQPFELLWSARACHPFGADGPVFDGTIRFLVAREDWGFSAYMAPVGLAVLTDGDAAAAIAPGATSTPLAVDPGFDIYDWPEPAASAGILRARSRD